jgi:hypothetical protein
MTKPDLDLGHDLNSLAVLEAEMKGDVKEAAVKGKRSPTRTSSALVVA